MPVLHDGMKVCVLDNGEPSPPLPVTNTLFRIKFSEILTDAFQYTDPGNDIKYRTDGKLNLGRIQVKTKVRVARLRDFLFADD